MAAQVVTQPAPAKPGPLARRIAAVQSVEPWRPAWLRNAGAKDLTGATR